MSQARLTGLRAKLDAMPAPAKATTKAAKRAAFKEQQKELQRQSTP